MVAMEAAAHGVPTVAYAVGGVPDAVLDGTSGVLVQPGDEVGFAEAVDRTLSVGFVRESVRGWAEQFDWHLFGDAIERELYIAVVEGHAGRGQGSSPTRSQALNITPPVREERKSGGYG